MKIKVIKEVYSEKQRRFFCASDNPKLKAKCDDPIKKENTVKESTYVLDREGDSGSTFDLDLKGADPSPLANAPQDERAKTWNRWSMAISGVVRPYFIKDVMQGRNLEKFADRLIKDRHLLHRVEGATKEGYMNPTDNRVITALAMPSHPEHKNTKSALMGGEPTIVKSAIAYLTVLGIEFATILKNRAFRTGGENPEDIMMDALEARFDNYILYGRGPAEQRDEFVKKSQEYSWDEKDPGNFPWMKDIRENKRKIKIKII